MMKQQLAALAFDAASMLVRGEDEVFDLVAERAYDLFGADGGVVFCHCLTDHSGGPQVRLHVGGGPPLGARWAGRGGQLAPRTPSFVAFRAVGDRDPVRVSDVLELP